ncbi:hypothetical protein QC762_100010 [Podospora pseudocomata]|uniref:Uncharacterized protein n=1 Tax=Podospora pseudocomata TaxID=2093779 RepID=A0ABR0GRE6_9PEZI|nr:hypothetical protein QC762_100010 [Podospora pseudocomata]
MDTGPDVRSSLSRPGNSQRPKLDKNSLDFALEREMGHSHMIQLVEQLTQQANEKLEIALHDSPTQNDSETFTKVFLKSLEGRLRCHIGSSIQRALRSVPGILTTPLPWPTHKAGINQSELDESFPTGFTHSDGARPRYQIGNLTQDALGESLRYSIGKAYESVASETARQTVNSTIETKETQPVQVSNDTKPHEFEPFVENTWNYASRSHDEKEC